MNKISACIVAKNEERLIERCLKSVKGKVDEINLFHDGPCEDKTIEIASKYADNIYILEEKGFCEPHMAVGFKKAAGPWILRIDADEFLPSDSADKLRELSQNKEADAYEFLWPLWNGHKRMTKRWPHKLCFFRKEKISFLALPHFKPKIKGKTLKKDIVLEHKPLYNNFTRKKFFEKWIPWARLHADILFRDISEIEKFNFDKNDLSPVFFLRKKIPLFFLVPDLFIPLFSSLSVFIYEKNKFFIIKYFFMSGIYRSLVDWWLFEAGAARHLKRFKFFLFGHRSPDEALRYLAAADIIKEYGYKKSRILDVGSGDLGIKPYAKDLEVVGLETTRSLTDRDESFKKNIYKGGAFPFPPDSFHLVMSVDSLEHVKKDKRFFLLKEMFKVSSKGVLVICPCGEHSLKQDQDLLQYARKQGADTQFLEEHIKNGLPESEELEAMIKKAATEAGKKVRVVVKEGNSNMCLRGGLMKLKISANFFLRSLYYLFSLLMPLRKTFNGGRCYRRVYYFEIL